MPETTVGAIVTRSNADGVKILLTRRNIGPFNGQWCLPGGHIDPYETVLDAVRREVREETGLDFRPRFLGFFDERIPEQDIHHVVIVFEGPGIGDIAPQAREVAQYGWFSIPEAQSMPLAFQHNDIVRAYSERRRKGRERATETRLSVSGRNAG